MNEKIEITSIPVKTTSDKIVLAMLCGLAGLAATMVTEKGYFAGKGLIKNYRITKAN